MSIAGSGTQQDPWIITTYDELVEKAVESGEFLRINNDINISDEYPDGDFPTLEIAADIDGNNKKISNWYRTTSDYGISISGSTSQVRDLTFANIYHTTVNNEFMTAKGYNANFHFVNCKFHGILSSRAFFSAYESDGSANNFSSCSFYIQSLYNNGAFVEDNWGYIGMRYCCVRVKGVAPYLFNTSRTTFVDSCYFETTMPIGAYSTIRNSVLDITSTTSFTASGSSSNALNIINADHAPNATASTGFALVDDDDWLDVDYLNSVGFNAG